MTTKSRNKFAPVLVVLLFTFLATAVTACSFSSASTADTLWNDVLQPEVKQSVADYLEDCGLEDASIQFSSVESKSAPLTDQNANPTMDLSSFSDRDKSLTLFTFDAVWNVYDGDQFVGEVSTKTDAVCHPTTFGDYPCRHVTSVIDNPDLSNRSTNTNVVETPLEAFVNHCHERYFTKADISSFDEDMARIARNAVYAHSGRKFEKEWLQTYFSQYSWYTPRIEASAFTTSMFNNYQTQNLQLITSYEKSKGYNSSSSAPPSNTIYYTYVPTVPTVPMNSVSLEYFVAYCHQRNFTRAEVSSFNKDMSKIARNAVYAHSGRIFNDQSLTNYFSQYWWYTPRIQPSAFSDSMLNSYQTNNLALIIAHEKAMGYR